MTVPAVPGVFVDANVLYSRTLRDWLALIYLQGDQSPYRVFWSEDVMAEVMYHLRREHPNWPGSRIAQIHDQLCGTFEVGRVTEFEVVDSGAVRDRNDGHVHAAAVASRADILLTCNVKDFPVSAGYTVMAPDVFFTLIDDSYPQQTRAAVREQINYWGGRGGTVDLPGALTAAGCPGFGDRVAGHLRELALRGY